MEYQLDKKMHGKNERAPMNQSTEAYHSKNEQQDVLERSLGDDAGKKAADWKGEHEGKGASQEESEVNMEGEATISPDDVMRAGGFGARDDIGCFLPVASDSTDLEASILDARDYEEPQAQGKVSRPGLGWSGTKHGE